MSRIQVYPSFILHAKSYPVIKIGGLTGCRPARRRRRTPTRHGLRPNGTGCARSAGASAPQRPSGERPGGRCTQPQTRSFRLRWAWAGCERGGAPVGLLGPGWVFWTVQYSNHKETPRGPRAPARQLGQGRLRARARAKQSWPSSKKRWTRAEHTLRIPAGRSKRRPVAVLDAYKALSSSSPPCVQTPRPASFLSAYDRFCKST